MNNVGVKERRGDRLVVTAWNCKQGRGSAVKEGLAAQYGQHRPDGMVLLECNGNHAAIRQWAKGRYNIIIGRGWEGRSTMLLVSKSTPILDSGTIRVKAPWRGPQGGGHTGRVFPWVKTMDADGDRALLVGIHMPWSWEKNQEQYRECLRALAEFADDRSAPAALLGDWNKAAGANGPWTPRRWGHRNGFDVVRTGAPIDYALVRDMRAHGSDGPRYGSDHRSVVYDIYPKG